MFVYLVITFQVYFPMASKDILTGFRFLRGGGLGQLIETHHVIQWNLDLTKSLGTGQICSLNGGFVISKIPI